MKNRFRGLSESRKLAMLAMSVEKIYNAAYEVGYTNGHETGYEVGAHNERTGACEEPAPKSPNQRRAELIQRARKFVEKHTELNRSFKELRYKSHVGYDVIPVFHVNQEKRVVTCLLKGAQTGRVLFKGIAKCMPGDVFNEWIGKAIALARALDIEVPAEFLEAVQPDEVVVGMVVETKNTFMSDWGNGKVEKINGDMYKATSGTEWNKHAVILDDTNAQYEDKP